MDAPLVPEIEVFDSMVRFISRSMWRDEQEEPVLDEIRTVDFYMLEDATVCEMSSRKIAAYGPLEIPKTKFGSIGVRIEPRLLAKFGGIVMADEGRRGTVEIVHEQSSSFVAYENALDENRRSGVFMSIPSGERGPWFIRDYGMAMHNATLHKGIQVEEGTDWTVSLRVAAYDNELNEERIHRFLR